MDATIENIKKIQIVSGEGEQGKVETYNGKRTVRALKSRITKECCGGDRWCYAKDADTDQIIDLDF